MKFILALLLVTTTFLGFSQGNIAKTDSLIKLYNACSSDSLKFVYSLEIGQLLVSIDIKKSTHFLEESEKHLQKEQLRVPVDTLYLYTSLINLNISLASNYSYSGRVEMNIRVLFEALKYASRLGNLEMEGQIIGRLAILQNEQGNYKDALEYYRLNIIIAHKINTPESIGLAFGNLGHYYSNHDIDSAMYYYRLSETYFKKFREARSKVGGYAWLLDNMADVFVQQNQLDSAELYYLKSLKMRRSIDHFLGQYLVLKDIAELEFELGNYKKALEVVDESIRIGKEKGFTINLDKSFLLRSKLKEQMGQYSGALEDYKLAVETKDSIINKENTQSLLRQTIVYQFQQEQIIDSIKNADEMLIKDLQIAQHRAEIESEKVIKYSLFAGVGCLVLIMAVLYQSFVSRKRRTRIILSQKQEVDAQNKQIRIQNLDLEHKNREITDSITYARRIQTAILPPDRIVKEYLQNSLVLYKPKDIVAGDFYWMEHKDGKVLFAAADCTGHGVPGALISVVCNNALNRAVREYMLSDPGKILDKTRELVIEEFGKSDEVVNDGMDIALCSLKNQTLEYAGAHNPLWIFCNGELLVTKANKEPIGIYQKTTNYKTHTFDLKKGDTVYIFSDGYSDQFGGPRGKKFKTPAFKKLLTGIQDQSMEDQRKIIDQTFEDWRGTLDQIDDVCIIGVKI